MIDVIRAPFTADQVHALEEYQRGEGCWGGPNQMHPFTCPNRGRGDHYKIDGELGVLVPTVRGWICPYCDYTQDWAHRFMVLTPGVPDHG